MRWSVAEARRNLARVLEEAEREPQPLFRRDRLAGYVVSGPALEEFEAWRAARSERTLGSRFRELRELLSDDLEAPERADRPNTFAETLSDELAG